MFVISVLNQKGGVGKTTTSLNLARAFQLMGYEVALVDSDPQGSARDWKAINEENPIPVFAIDRPTIHTDVKNLSNMDIVIVDGAPSLKDMSVSAIKAANLIIIPCQPSPLDLWAASALVDMVKQRIELTDGELKAAFLVNRKKGNTKLGKDVASVLHGYELDVLDSAVSESIDYATCVMEGKTIHDNSNKKKTGKESWEVAEEILNKYIKPALSAQ